MAQRQQGWHPGLQEESLWVRAHMYPVALVGQCHLLACSVERELGTVADDKLS